MKAGHGRDAVLLQAQRAASQLQNRSLGQEALLHRQLREAREAQAICSQVHPEHRNRAPASDGLLTISWCWWRLSKITIGLVCKETKNTGLSAVPFYTLCPPPPRPLSTAPQQLFGQRFIPSAHVPCTSRHRLPGNTQEVLQQEGSSRNRSQEPPALPPVSMEHLWQQGIWQQPPLPGKLGLASARCVPFHQGCDANRTAYHLSHMHPPGHCLIRHLG